MPTDPLRITTERQSARHVVRACGEIDLSTVPDFEAALVPDATSTAVVADLTDVTFLASCGLSALIQAHERGQRTGARLLVVVPPAGTARRALQVTGLLSVLTVADSLADALADRPVSEAH